MNSMKKKNKSHAKFNLIVLGALGLVTILIFDVFYLKVGLFPEGWPNFSPEYVLRSLIIFASVGATVFGFASNKKSMDIVVEFSEDSSWESPMLYGALGFAVTFLFLIMAYPDGFYINTKEDGLIEWTSAFFSYGELLIYFIFVAEVEKRCECFIDRKMGSFFFSSAILLDRNGRNILVPTCVRY